MLLDHFLQFYHIIFGSNLIGGYHFLVQTDIQIIVLVQHISDTTAHTCRKVLAGSAKDYHTTTCHILTSMIANAFHNSNGS